MTIKQYLSEHLIVSIGNDIPGHIYTDVIVDNPIEFVELIATSPYFISSILWWEIVDNNACPNLGGGGIADPRSSEKCYFAEIDLCRDFFRSTTVEEYKDYIQHILMQYPALHLYPSFDIAYR